MFEGVAVAGAEIRLRVRVSTDHREAARRAALAVREELLSRGAISVKLEEVVIAETRSRTPEVARAVTLPAKLEAFWASKGFAPGDRRDALLGKALELEEAHRAA